MKARLLAILLLAQLPWLGTPVHHDEANFLVLARGAAADPWRPHAIALNWQGKTERAFDVLSNPPGIAWWLAPLAEAPVWAQRAWMLPWWALAVIGAEKLGRRQPGGALLLLTAPIVLLSGTALLPDLPLYACVLAGVGGFVDATDRGRPAWPWALLGGCAALFRYSGVVIPGVLGLVAFSRGRPPWAAAASLGPLALLAAHDLHAYGELHLLAMRGFQAVANTPTDVWHKGAAALCMLGGAAAIPAFRWSGVHAAGAVAGAALAVAWGPLAAVFGALGGAAFAGAVAERRVLAAWAVFGLLFLLSLRFTATRYWLPFLPALLLARPRGPVGPAIVLQTSLGLLLLADDAASARGSARLAEAAAELGRGSFTGHWGWQWALEARGWSAAEAGARVEGLLAVPTEAWPQPVEPPCLDPIWSAEAAPPWPWLPRGYSREGRANLHANWIAGSPMIRTVLPWTFADDPYERARVCRVE